MSDQTAEDSETGERDDDERAGVAYEAERLVTREEGAAALRRLADGVANGSVELGAGEVTATVPGRFEMEIEYEQEPEEAELEVELEWPIVDGEAVEAQDELEAPPDDGNATEMGGASADADDGEEARGSGDEDDEPAEADVGGPIDEVVGAGDTASKARFELYRDRADDWRWRLVHDNGNIIADSGGGYDRISAARGGMESVMRNAPGATVVETDD